MPQRRLTLVPALLLCAVATAAQTSTQDSVLPKTGLDFSGVDRFWDIVAILSKDAEPSAAQWHALLATPGDRLAAINLGPALQPPVHSCAPRSAAPESLLAP